MPGDEIDEGAPLSRSELIRRLNLIVDDVRLWQPEDYRRAVAMVRNLVEEGPIVEDIDVEVMEITRATFDLSASRDETHVTIVARISGDQPRAFVKERLSQAFDDLDGIKPGSSINYRLIK